VKIGPRSKYVLIFIVILVSVTTIYSAIPYNFITLKSGVAVGYSGDIYVAYVDFSGLRAKIVVLNINTGEEVTVSDPDMDAQEPKFCGEWLMWKEMSGSGMRRIVWLNVSSRDRVTLTIDKGMFYPSASSVPTVLKIDGGNATLYKWNGSAFECHISRNMSGGEVFYIAGERVWYAYNCTVYDFRSREPLHTFNGTIEKFICTPDSITAALSAKGGSDVVFWNGTTEVILGNYREVSDLSSLQVNGSVYITFEVYGKHKSDYSVIFITIPKGNISSAIIRDIWYGGSAYNPSIATDGASIYVCYILHKDLSIWCVALEDNSGKKYVLKGGIYGMGDISLMYVIIGAVLVIVGSLPGGEKELAFSEGMIPLRIRFSNHYHPYAFLKILCPSIVAILYASWFIYLGVLSKGIPSAFHQRYFPQNIMVAFTFFVSFMYIVSFREERRTSTLHTVSYGLSISAFMLSAITIWGIFNSNQVEILLLFFAMLSLMLLLVSISLTLVALTGFRHMWLQGIGMVFFMMPFLISITTIKEIDAYITVTSVYAALGIPYITMGLLAIAYSVVFIIDVMMIPKEKFIPVSEWSTEDYLTTLYAYTATSLLSIGFFSCVIILFSIYNNPLGIVAFAPNDIFVYISIIFIIFCFIFIVVEIHHRSVKNITDADKISTHPSKVIATAVFTPLLNAFAAMTMGILLGLLSSVIILVCVWEVHTAYKFLKDKIINVSSQ